MGLIEHKKVQILSQFIRSQFLRKFTKLVLSVSVFSVLISQSSFISMLQSLHFYFYILPFRLLSHNIDKNFMFLLCNGLLVVLAKYSSSVGSSSSKHDLGEDDSFKGCDNHHIQHYDDSAVTESEVSLLEKEYGNAMEGAENDHVIKVVSETKAENVAIEEEKQDQQEESDELIKDGEHDRENGDLSGDEVEENNDGFIPEEEDLEEEEEEDLNRKFDEFIRKMKEELRLEARQQLIMVQ